MPSLYGDVYDQFNDRELAKTRKLCRICPNFKPCLYKTLIALVEYSLRDESSSHIILIPFVAFFLLYVERRRIFSTIQTSIALGLGPGARWGDLLLPRRLGACSAEWKLATLSGDARGGPSMGGGFVLCYGVEALRAGSFPLLFLLLMVPLPDVVLNRVIAALQEGSTEIAYLIFQAVGTPVSRNGFLLSVPGVTIEVAKECSSIRSSIALLVTCLLAAHLYLRTAWKFVVLVVLGLLLSIVKNGIRIVTLTLLSVLRGPWLSDRKASPSRRVRIFPGRAASSLACLHMVREVGQPCRRANPSA